jgi:hypothetical protein
MYAVTAIAERGDDEPLTKDPATMWLDGGSTHHIVCSQDNMINCTASPVSSVLAAGGEATKCCAAAGSTYKAQKGFRLG